MQIVSFKEEMNYIMILDFFSQEEINAIIQECIEIYPLSQGATETMTARDQYGNPLKKNSGVFLDVLFENHRGDSNILKYSRKIFDPKILKQIIDADPVFGLLATCKQDSTLISYYHDGDYYMPHHDDSTVTVLSYFLPENINFDGGSLVFSEKNIEIKPKHNMVIIMLGCYKHAVTMVRKISEESPHVLRICMSQFCYHPINR